MGSDAGGDGVEEAVQVVAQEGDGGDDDDRDEGDHEAVLNGGGTALTGDESSLKLGDVVQHCDSFRDFRAEVLTSKVRQEPRRKVDFHLPRGSPIGRLVTTPWDLRTHQISRTVDVESSSGNTRPVTYRIVAMPGVSRFPRRSVMLAAAPGMVSILLLPLIAVRPVSDPSPWLHLKVGRFLAEGNRFADPDPWAPFAGRQYVPTQWLPSVISSQLYERWGLESIVWSRAVGVVALFLVLLILLNRTCRSSFAVPLAGAGVAASWPWLTERPQLLGFILLVPALGAWWETARDARPRWWLIPLTWVAAMCHGVWAMGLVAGAIVTVGLMISASAGRRRIARLVGLLAACVTAASLTPLGPKLLLTPFSVGSNGRQFVLEWMPASVRTPAVALVLATLATVWLLWVIAARRPPAPHLLLFVAAVIFALTMQRTVPIGAVLAVLLLGEAAETLTAARSGMPSHRSSTTVALAWAGAAVAASLLALPLAGHQGEGVGGVPMALGERLQELPRGSRVMAFGDLTGWVMFTAPQVEPVFDLRIEQYSPSYVRSYIRAMRAEPGWDAFLSRTGTNVALLEEDAPLTAALTEQLGWRVAGRSNGFILLERDLT